MDTNWLDLPRCLLGFILTKLHFVDQIRALAVCKTWRDCKDFVTCSDTLPWVVTIRKQHVADTHSFTFDLFDPYSRKVHNISNSRNIDPRGYVLPLASKKGWLFIGGDRSKPFLYNPFTNDYIHSIFPWIKCIGMSATINTDPDMEVYTVTVDDFYLLFDTYTTCSSRLTNGSIFEFDEPEIFCSVLYMKGIIYGLSCSERLYRNRSEDRSWDLLNPGPFEPTMAYGWLMELNENLIMVRLNFKGEGDDDPYDYEWKIFKFDWSEMSWDVETSLESCAIYISGGVAFSTPLVDRRGKKLQGCKLFYHNKFDEAVGGVGFKCFSLSDVEETQMIHSEEFGWITGPDGCQFSFIEPPYYWS